MRRSPTSDAAFAALGPLVLGCCVVLLPFTLLGWVMPLVSIPGALGLVGLAWSWVTFQSGAAQQTAFARGTLLGCGLFAAVAGVTLSFALGLGFVLRQWCLIYAGLASLFLLDTAFPGLRATAAVRPAWKIASVLLFWMFSAAIAVVPYLDAREEARLAFENSEPQVRLREFRGSAFAKAFCGDELDRARAQVARIAQEREHVLETAFRECYAPGRVPTRFRESEDDESRLAAAKLQIAVEAIAGYAAAHPSSRGGPCPAPVEAFLSHAYGHGDFDAIALLHSRGVRVDCPTSGMSPRSPLWFALRTRGERLTVRDLDRLKQAGINLAATNAIGEDFAAAGRWDRLSPEVVKYFEQLRSQ